MPDDDEINFQFLAEHSADILCRSGMDRIIRYVSPSCFHILGWTPEEMKGKGPEAFILPEDFPALETASRQILTNENHTAIATVRMRRKDGSATWVEMNGRLVFDSATGEPSEYVLVMRDVTERKREEERIAASADTGHTAGLANRHASDLRSKDEVNFRSLAEHSVDVILRLNLKHVIEYISPSCFNLLGYKPEELIGKTPDVYVLAEYMHVVEATAAKAFTSESHSGSGTAKVRRKDKSIRWVEANVRLVRDSSTGEPQEFVVILRDITERKCEEAKLTSMALTDGLTGLSNRRAFDRTLKREWKRTLREGSQMALLLLDIDHFKELNDMYGHMAGDDCLRTVAVAVSGAVRATDNVARYGGEEMAIILPACDIMGAVDLAEQVRLAIESLRIPNEGNPEGGGWVTASVGVAAAFARQGGTIKMPESLLLAADSALYKAKYEGRNRVATAILVASKRT